MRRDYQKKSMVMYVRIPYTMFNFEDESDPDTIMETVEQIIKSEEYSNREKI